MQAQLCMHLSMYLFDSVPVGQSVRAGAARFYSILYFTRSKVVVATRKFTFCKKKKVFCMQRANVLLRNALF